MSVSCTLRHIHTERTNENVEQGGEEEEENEAERIKEGERGRKKEHTRRQIGVGMLVHRLLLFEAFLSRQSE